MTPHAHDADDRGVAKRFERCVDDVGGHAPGVPRSDPVCGGDRHLHLGSRGCARINDRDPVVGKPQIGYLREPVGQTEAQGIVEGVHRPDAVPRATDVLGPNPYFDDRLDERGSAPGSLGHYLVAVHLEEWRVFPHTDTASFSTAATSIPAASIAAVGSASPSPAISGADP